MIAVDTSAIVAILWSEQPSDALRQRLDQAGAGIVSAANALELQLVLAGAREGPEWREAERLLTLYKIAIWPLDDLQLAIARDAALRFGRGLHPAKLNFGDCFAYALAKSEGVPLLYVGGDFALTDIEAA